MSDNNKHTIGPWEVREVDGLFAIAHYYGWVLESHDNRQNRVDALIMAAAPDLLKALTDLCNVKGDDLPYAFEEWNAAHAAIAKATGGESNAN